MKDKNRKKVSRAHLLLLLSAAAMLTTAVTETARAKSLYVIADIVGKPTPVHAYDVGADGTLIFQALDKVPRYSFGAVGMAIDEDSAYLFITYEDSDNIQLVNAMTMIETSTVIAPGAINLAGIAYDHGKGLLYCVDRGTEKIYVYDWDPETTTLTNVTDSATLAGASAYGIALDEVNGLLYVANYSNTLRVYHTSDWSLARTISLSRLAVSIAIDVQRGFLYLGGGYVEDEDFVTRYNPYLTQYNLETGTEAAVQVDPDAGVIGLSVDITTGNVYTTTGRNNREGGDNLLVYDTALNRIDVITGLGNPTGLVVPAKDIGYNPLNLKKEIIEGAIGETGVDNTKLVGIGRDFTYGIYFDNSDEDLTLTDVTIVDTLPEQVSFVTANDDGANGHYDPNTHTYTWLYSSVPPQSAARLELVAHVNEDTAPGTTIRNYVTVDSSETPPTTVRLDVVSHHAPLNLSKNIIGAVVDDIPGVDLNETLTYEICFDNNDNDITVTDVFVLDILPPEVDFVTADEDGVHGQYNPAAHTYTWSYASLPPGLPICLSIVVQVKGDPNIVQPGTTITNLVIADSNETLPSTTSVDVITYYNPLNLSKSIVGAIDGEVEWVDVNETITYRICVDNNDNDAAVTNVSIVDTLPQEVSFVTAETNVSVVDTLPQELSFATADGDGIFGTFSNFLRIWSSLRGSALPSSRIASGGFGQYDPNTHTYEWSYESLEPGEAVCLELVVQVNQDAASGATITNSVIADSNESPPSAASVDATTKYDPLNLSKSIIGAVEGQVTRMDRGETFFYGIRVDNFDNDYAVNNVSIVDTLPQEVSFVSAEDHGTFGQYDPDTHTYTWSYPSLQPGTATYLQLAVRVEQDTPWLKTFTNSVTVDSNETEPLTASVNVSTPEGPLKIQDLRILPKIIRRTGNLNDIQAVATLPAGFGKSQIRDVAPTLEPVLYPDNKIVAKHYIIAGTASSGKVLAVFDRAQLLNAVPGHGRFTMRFQGRFISGRAFYGEAVIQISRFAGS